MKTIFFFCFLFITTSSIFAQTTDRISQLVSTENYFAALVKKKGIKKAFLNVSDDNTLLFRPQPVLAEKYFSKQDDSTGILTWDPVYARISKSDDWGFTTGPFVYQEYAGSISSAYGQYCSIWKKNRNGVWKLALDIGISHKKPLKSEKLLFKNAENQRYLHQRSAVRLQQREDIVFSSDQLFGTILKADNRIALKEFIGEECRLLFPGYEPILGKEAINAFWEKQKSKITSQPTKADRSYSGELAYTYGTANIETAGKTKKYNYVRIWEIQTGFNWNVILEVFSEA